MDPHTRDSAHDLIRHEHLERAHASLSAWLAPEFADHLLTRPTLEVIVTLRTLREALIDAGLDLELVAKAEGATYAEIGAAQGLSRQAVHRSVSAQWKHAVSKAVRDLRPEAVKGERRLPL